jgi:anti-repressor protein
VRSLQVIDQREVLGKDFRVYGTADDPLFLAKDVAVWIEYDLSSAHKLVAMVDQAEKVRKSVPTPGGNQEMWLLTEDGLYEVLMQSRKPIAKQFKKCVKQILREIRRHGAYLTPEKLEEVLLNPDTIIRLATDLKAEREARAALAAKVEQDKPKVLFAESVTASDSTILIRELAKVLKQNGIDTGEKRLFEWLRQNGYLISKEGSDYNTPAQRSMEMGLFEVQRTTITLADGRIKVKTTPKVTGKGQIYFVNKLKPAS